MSTETDVALRAAAEAATPGPWETYENMHAEVGVVEAGRGLFGTVHAPVTGREEYGRPDSRFIAAANPAAVLDLLDRMEAAEAKVARVEALHEPVHWHIGNLPGQDQLVRGESCDDRSGFHSHPHCRLCGLSSQWPCQTRAALGDPQ